MICCTLVFDCNKKGVPPGATIELIVMLIVDCRTLPFQGELELSQDNVRFEYVVPERGRYSKAYEDQGIIVIFVIGIH